MSGSVEPENNWDRKPKKNVHQERENVAEDLHDKRESEEAAAAAEDAEDVFFSANIPPWWEQITLRGIAASVVLGGLFCIITHKLTLTVGVIPSLNVAAGLVGFFMIKTWTKFLAKFGLLKKPFTRQENTVIQTCVVACYGIAFSGGFGTYIVAMDEATRQKTGPTVRGNDASAVKTPHLGWMFAFIFAVSFLGLCAVVPLRKIMIIDYKLTYPSGTATAVLINSFHTPQGQAKAKMQVLCLAKYFIISFLWSFFKWFFSGNGDCGFDNFPIFGLKAFENKFYTDFSTTYVGAGMICPHLVNLSMLFGGIVSWGLMWPLIRNREGDWFPAGLHANDLKGLYGYKIFIAVAIILGDGIYNFVKILTVTIFSLYQQHKRRGQLPVANSDINNPAPDEPQQSLVEKNRNEIFMKGSIPFHVAATAYVALAAISTGVMPKIFHQVKWYYVLSGYVAAPILGFCNSYGCGLTDWSLASNYGKLGLFIFAAWAGSDGGVIAGLALMGVMMVIVNTASDLMQDFKTGYLTMSSPRSMFASQIIGTAMGCILAPLTFWMFWTAFDIGVSKEYPAPYAAIYRQMALIGIDGFSALPKHCLQLCYGFFAFAVITNLIKDFVPKKVSAFIPIPMAMAIPFYIGPYFAIDMFVGTVIVFVWTKLNKPRADLLVPAVASGLICGDGLWTLPSAILALAKKNPPLCMTFLSRSDAAAQLHL